MVECVSMLLGSVWYPLSCSQGNPKTQSFSSCLFLKLPDSYGCELLPLGTFKDIFGLSIPGLELLLACSVLSMETRWWTRGLLFPGVNDSFVGYLLLGRSRVAALAAPSEARLVSVLFPVLV